MKKKLFYAVCSAVVSLTFFIELYSVAKNNPSFWGKLILFNIAVWSSYPRYRSTTLKMVTITLTMIVLANPLMSGALEALSPRSQEVPRMAANVHRRINMVEGAVPGMSGLRHFSVDGQGFRTNGPIDYAHKPEGIVRIATFGASTMEEGYVDDRQTWTYRVADQLSRTLGRKVEMINTAFSGMRAKHNYIRLVESRAYAPDIAIFLMGINDWNHDIREQLKSDYPLGAPGQTVPMAWLSVSETILYRAVDLLHVRVISLLERWGRTPVAINEDGAELKSKDESLARKIKVDFRPQAVSEEYAGWIRKIIGECHERKIQCIFVDQPTAYHEGITPELSKRLWMTPNDAPYTLTLPDISYVARFYNDWLGRQVKEKGFRFCSISPQMLPTTDYFFDDCHYNDNGSLTVARLVSECIGDLR